MKKYTIVSLFLILSLSLNAQTKVTKTNIIGKWAISTIEMAGKFYFNIETDSLSLGTAILNDGGELLGNDADSKSKASYTIDEEASSITTKDSDKKENTMKVDILDSKLRIKQTQPEGEFILSLKKVTI